MALSPKCVGVTNAHTKNILEWGELPLHKPGQGLYRPAASEGPLALFFAPRANCSDFRSVNAPSSPGGVGGGRAPSLPRCTGKGGSGARSPRDPQPDGASPNLKNNNNKHHQNTRKQGPALPRRKCSPNLLGNAYSVRLQPAASGFFSLSLAGKIGSKFLFRAFSPPRLGPGSRIYRIFRKYSAVLRPPVSSSSSGAFLPCRPLFFPGFQAAVSPLLFSPASFPPPPRGLLRVYSAPSLVPCGGVGYCLVGVSAPRPPGARFIGVRFLLFSGAFSHGIFCFMY